MIAEGAKCLNYRLIYKNLLSPPGFHRIFTASPYKGNVTKGNEPEEVET